MKSQNEIYLVFVASLSAIYLSYKVDYICCFDEKGLSFNIKNLYSNLLEVSYLSSKARV